MTLLAQFSVPGDNGTPVQISVPPGIPTNVSLGALASGFISVAMIIGIFLSLIYLVYGGIYWTQSKGNKETLDKARRIIIYAILGLVIMSLSLVGVNLISSALGVTTPLNP